jgi:DNA-binding CsgD family transcriptional regulator
MAPDGVIGRTDELATIDEFIAGFPAGDRALVLAGEAGIGKTILWGEAERRARARDLIVLTCRASASEVELAYVVVTDLLARVAPPILPTLPRPQAEALAGALLVDAPAPDQPGPAAPVMTDPRTVGTAVLGTLRAVAAERPVLLALDDVQWIDSASAAALEFALRRVDDVPVGILATIRTLTTAEAGAGPRIAAAFGERTRILDVGPISLGVLHHLVRERTGAVLSRPQLVRLEGASRGNPLLAIEIARELGRLDRWPIAGEPLPIPTDTAALLGDRLGRLSEAERDVLFVVAAMSSPTVESVAAALDSTGDVSVRAFIDRAIQDGLLTSAGDGGMRFGHPLMAEAALRAVPPARSRRLHERLADLAPLVEDRGRHTALAAEGPNSEAAERVEAAAWSARTRGATAVAAGWAEAAARLTPDDDGMSRATRLLAAGTWFADAGEVDRARELVLDAIAGLPSGDARATARLTLAQLAGWDGGPAAVVQGCEAALAEALDPDLRARIHLRLAVEPEVVGYAAAAGHADAAVDELEALADPDPDLLACALLQSANARFEAGGDDDVEAVTRAASLLDVEPRRSPAGDVRPESLRAHALLWQWAADHDDLEGALAGALVEIRRTRDLLGMDRPVPILEADIAYLLAWMGDLANARGHAQAAIEAADVLDTREGRSVALSGVGVVALHAGDVAETERAARAGLALGADPPDWLDARHEANVGSAALLRGDVPAATTVLGGLFDRLVGLGARGSTNLRFAGDLVEAAIAAGDLPRALRVIESLEGTAAISPTPWVRVMVARGRALLSAAEGNLDAADEAATLALRAAPDLPMPIERARTELVAGRIARRRKEKRRAGEHLDRAIEGFRAVGAEAWLAVADADLARLGRQRRAGDELTETEDRVARLAAAGMTNREVGEAAFLTAKSVEGVLARVYGKLGIRSRAELGAWVAGQESDVDEARVTGRQG